MNDGCSWDSHFAALVKRVDKHHPALADGANPPTWATPREICTAQFCGGTLEFKDRTAAVVYHTDRAEAHPLQNNALKRSEEGNRNQT